MASLGPYLVHDLVILCLAIMTWISYVFVSNLWYVLIFSIIMTLLALWAFWSSLFVGMRRVLVTDLFVAVTWFGTPRKGVYWKDIERIVLFERDRGYLPPKRTDRMVQIYFRGQIAMTINPNSWPEKDEREFLEVLDEASRIHDFAFEKKG